VVLATCSIKKRCRRAMESENTYEVVKDYYGKVLANSKDLKTNACVCCERPPDHILNAIKEVPREVRICLHEQSSQPATSSS
jgi:hypothetical protein